MRRLPIALVLAALALAAGGCGGEAAAPDRTVASAPEDGSPPSQPRTATITQLEAEPAAESEDGHGELGEAERSEPVPLGRSVALDGPGFALELTALEVVDPAPGAPAFTPQRDNRFVAVLVELRNIGEAVYADTPSSGGALLTANGDEHRASVVPAALEPLERVELEPGSSARGHLTFEVPGDAELVELRLTPLSGFGSRAAVWSLAPG